jgi:hypothetical protein
VVRAAGTWLALVTLAGCAKGVDTTGFESFSVSIGSTSPTTNTAGDSESTGDDGVQTTSISADASASDTSGGSTSAGSDGESEGEAEGSTSGVDAGESTTSGDPSTTGMTSNTTNMSGGESTDDGGNNGSQPADGMYSACTMANNTCTMAPVTICVYTMTDGFCTADGCANPAQDCDPSPGGTADPICLSAPPYSFCALDCSGGATCPTGMTCTAVTFDMVTNYDICM